MKKIYLSLLFVAASIFNIDAQFKMTQKSFGIVAGDAHLFTFTDAVSEGLAGKNVTWDYSTLKENGKTLTSHMFKSMETPKGAEISEANTAIEEFGNVFYFKETATGIEHLGYASGNTLIKYDKPMLKLKFPMVLGDKFTGDYAGTQNSGGNDSKFTGKYEISVDASGKLILPKGITINNVIRVKQSRTFNCTGGCNYTEVIYRWYSKDAHYPLFVIIKNLTDKGEVASTLTAYHPLSKSETTSEAKESILTENGIKVKCYPNPWGNKLSVNYDLQKEENVQVSILDLSGNPVKVIVPSTIQVKGHYSYTLTDESIKAGVYFLQIKHGKEVVSKKLIKMF